MAVASLELEVVLLFILFMFSQHMLVHSVEGKECPTSFPCPNCPGRVLFPPLTDCRRPECGPFPIDCTQPTPMVRLFDQQGIDKWYSVVKSINQDTTTILDLDLEHNLQNHHCEPFPNSVPSSSFVSFTILNLTVFNCNSTLSADGEKYSKNCPGFKINYNLSNHDGSTPDIPPPRCLVIWVPRTGDNEEEKESKQLFEMVSANVTLDYKVQRSSECLDCNDQVGQRCGKLDGDGEILGPKNGDGEPDGPENGRARKLFLEAIGIAASVSVIGIIIVILYVKRKFGSVPLLFCWGSHMETSRHVESFLRSYGSAIPRRYSYSEVKKMTNSFKSKLGQGGCGSVYKGKLLDGRLVAVKVISKSRGDGQEFMNEVASIGRTSHVNIVTLLGYCFEGQKRALVYEFMAKGSLEKFIFAEEDLEHPKLGWETLYQIALGIARGLEYLHRGCNTCILHFDIKPHNILLDEDFHPKISDFGLAKLCPKKESIISMSDPRGTIGYIAPEVVCRTIGRVSHKSDVYSYGMMVLEIVGGRKNVNTGADRTSEIYFPNWIYKRVQLCEDPGLCGISNEEDKEKTMKMVLVSLWCIQTDPSNRPTMSQVVDMLLGSLESLQMPPRPYLSSPPRSPPESPTTYQLSV